MSAWTKRSEHRSGFKSLCLTAQQADVRLTIRKGASAQSETCQKPKNLKMLRVHKHKVEREVDVWVRWQACNWRHVQNEERALHAQPDE